ncbi:MAG: Rpn family recombination-promoting nuclease/putative transposase [Planctomycetota bacterium]
MGHLAHDSLVKAIFTRVENAAGEFRSMLPKALLKQLKLKTLRVVAGSFVDESLRQRFTDLLFVTETKAGEPALLYILFEHQSRFDRHLPLRVYVYQGQIWQWWLREHPQARHLPMLVTVVLQHDHRSRRGRSFGELFDRRSAGFTLLQAHFPEFHLLIDNLSAQQDEAIRARSMTALVKIALLALKHARDSADLMERIVGWLGLCHQVKRTRYGTEALAQVMRYILSVSDHVEVPVLERLLEAELGEWGRAIMGKAAEMLTKQARREARAEGKVEGRAEERRELLLRLLQRRFGKLPKDALERVQAASPETLLAWADRVVTATRMDEVFVRSSVRRWR